MAAIENSSYINISSDSFGEHGNPCLVMISGKSTTMKMWRGMPEKLASTGLHVIVFDNRDMGTSKKFSDFQALEHLSQYQKSLPYEYPYTLDDMADDVVRVLDNHGINRAHILGASLGGLIGQIFATRYPNRALTLTAIMSTMNINYWASKGFSANPEYFMKILKAQSPSKEMTLQEFLENRTTVWTTLLTDEYHPVLSVDERELLISEMKVDFERGAVDFDDAGGMRQMLATNAWTDKRLEDHKALMSNLQITMLVIHGKYDKLFPIEAAEELASLVPKATMQLYDGGHNLPLDQQERIVEMISQHVMANSP